MVRKTIVVTTSYEGIHCYPGSPCGVEFLQHLHRHMFGVRVEAEVFHNDRELEFILLKRTIGNLIKSKQDEFGVWQMGAMSCEMVADWLVKELQIELLTNGDSRYIKVTIDEDGENGASVEVIPTKEESEKMTEHKIEITMSDYQKLAYYAIQPHKSKKEEVIHWAVGLGEEAGETQSVIKHKFYGGEFTTEKLMDELGDTLWHIAALCTAEEISLEEVAARNLDKIHHRYPQGVFDFERSKKRHEIDQQSKGE